MYVRGPVRSGSSTDERRSRHDTAASPGARRRGARAGRGGARAGARVTWLVAWYRLYTLRSGSTRRYRVPSSYPMAIMPLLCLQLLYVYRAPPPAPPVASDRPSAFRCVTALFFCARSTSAYTRLLACMCVLRASRALRHSLDMDAYVPTLFTARSSAAPTRSAGCRTRSFILHPCTFGVRKSNWCNQRLSRTSYPPLEVWPRAQYAYLRCAGHVDTFGHISADPCPGS